MQVFDQHIYDIVEKGLQGNGLTEEETLALYRVEASSKEAAYIRRDPCADRPQQHHLSHELQVLLLRLVQHGAQGQV